MIVLYKVLGEAGRPCHGGQGRWALPDDGTPGVWMPEITGPLVACERGYHLVALAQLPQWLGPTIYVAEGAGEHIDAGDKHVYARARLLSRVVQWDERTARLYACLCAEHVLHLYEGVYPNDRRCRDAIRVARAYAEGHASHADLRAAQAAARAAAGAATRAAWAAADAARDAARDAVDAAGAAWAAAWAATRAARAAAGAAAGAAEGAAAAAAAERAWQADRLGELLAAPGDWR